MGIRALVVLGVIAAALCMWGGQKTYVAIRDRQQLEISCADYVKKQPSARWLKLVDCEYDFDHLAYEQESSGDKYKAVYFPLRPAGEEGGPTHIVVKRDDAAMLQIVYAFEHGNEHPPGMDQMVPELLRPVEGLVQFGLDLDDKDKEELGKLNLGLANDFVILDNGSKPNLVAGLILLLLGLGVGGALVWFGIMSVRERKRRPPQRPFTMGPPGPMTPVSPFERPI